MEKLFFSGESRTKFFKALDAENWKEVKSLYDAFMLPVIRTSYNEDSLFLEDLEWDIMCKRDLLDVISNSLEYSRLLKVIGGIYLV